MADPKKSPTSTGAKRGKTKGTATVTPRAADVEGADAQGSLTPDTNAAREAIPAGIDREIYQEGYDASVNGTPSKPPASYTDEERWAWHVGYQSHANPKNGGPVANIEGGYRGNY